MSDLEERLRTLAKSASQWGKKNSELIEAADELARLRAENERLNSEYGNTKLMRAEQRCERYRSALDEAIGIARWMSGSPSFAPEGEAHEGWIKARDTLNAMYAEFIASEALHPEGESAHESS